MIAGAPCARRDVRAVTMHLHTRLLLGIALVTLIAVGLSILLPLSAGREEVSRETDASLQLARLLLEVQRGVAAAVNDSQALEAAAARVRLAEPLRHVRVQLLDQAGRVIALSPPGESAGALARAFLPSSTPAPLAYPIVFHGATLAQLRVSSNPLSEAAEIGQRAERDLVMLVLTILVVGSTIFWIVRVGLRPLAQIQAALTRLEGGELETRLPRLGLKDLDEISARFNHCAAVMQAEAAQRRELTRRLIDVEEDERSRLARELHDELGQRLTAIKVDAAYIARESAAFSPQIQSCARELEQLASGIMELIRGMLARLRPHGLETLGLHEALQELVNGWQMRLAERFSCRLSFRGRSDCLSPDLNITVYRVVQECLTNVVRHSRAHSVSVDVDVQEPQHSSAVAMVCVEVRELDAPRDAAPERWSEGTGLLGMRERVAAHGGELTIKVDPNGGMLLRAWMPLAQHFDELAHA